MFKEIRSLVFPVAILIIGLSGVLVWQNLTTDALDQEIFVATENNYIEPITSSGATTGSGTTSSGTTSSGTIIGTATSTNTVTPTTEPLGSINNPFTDLSSALAVVTPGDTIYLRGGTYQALTSDDFAINGINGTPDNPILITNYNDEEVIIDGQNGTFAWDIFNIVDSTNIVIEGIQVINNPTQDGVNIYNSSDITLRNLEVAGNNTNGIEIANSEEIRLFSSVIYNNNENGVYVNNSSRVNLSGNYIYSTVSGMSGVRLSNEINNGDNYLNHITLVNNIIGQGYTNAIRYDELGGNFSNIRILNNNLVGQSAESIYISDGVSSGGNRVINNIISQGSVTGTSLELAQSESGDFEFSNNVWIDGFPTVGIHNNSYAVDPLFAGDISSAGSVTVFRLQDTSPIIGYGMPVGSVTTDYFGTSRDAQRPTPGIFEPFAVISTEENVEAWHQTINPSENSQQIEDNASLVATLASNNNDETQTEDSRWDASNAGWGKDAYADYNTGGDDFLSDNGDVNGDDSDSSEGSDENGDGSDDTSEDGSDQSGANENPIQATIDSFNSNGNSLLILCLCLCLIPFILLLLLYLLLTSRDREREDRGEYITS